MTTDNDRAKAFLEKVSTGQGYNRPHNLIYKCKKYFSENEYVTAISILHCWLLEQLRCGGKNTVDIDEDTKSNQIIVYVFVNNEAGVRVASLYSHGKTDLDALIQAFNQFKELNK